MGTFITDGASVLPGVKTDARPSTGASTEWAATDANEVRSALLDLRTAALAVQSGFVDPNVAMVIATGSDTPRALQDRFADVVNVKDFGATGLGGLDDTAAIQAAIDSLAATGGTVYFPPGQYLVTAINLAGPYTTCLAGSEVERTVLLGTTGTTGPVLSIDGNYISEVVIRQMTVDMWANAANATGIMLKNGARRCLFEKVQVIGNDESHKLVSVGDSVTASHDVAFNSCELDGDGYVYVCGGSLSTEPTYSVSFNKCRLGIVDALNVAALVIRGGTINGAATVSHTALIKLRTARGVTIDRKRHV